ncbi:hypothetical protein FBQ97_08070 [Acidobacteria bacterium ACD]|nr:MAG: hypothetical protein EDX89_02145 [Acidobacteriota bacterium]MCE7960126.1 hypothetical protein [Acidobacteria bacterium ACB2]MDL1949751.1 hypothetical protein [Acidobacteria bacterium ACD]
MTKAALKHHRQRVRRALEYVKKRLKLDHEFVVVAGEPKEQFGLLDIQRSDRGTEDKKTWIVTFDADLVAGETMQALRRHAFHEMLHALTWPLFDETEAAIRRIPDSRVRQEVLSRALDARENIVYDLERKVGPLAFPHLPWNEP